jgi:hypothetical protein
MVYVLGDHPNLRTPDGIVVWNMKNGLVSHQKEEYQKRTPRFEIDLSETCIRDQFLLRNEKDLTEKIKQLLQVVV